MSGSGRTLLESLDWWTLKCPSKVALTFLDDAGVEVDTLTYEQLNTRSSALAQHLRNNLKMMKGSTCLLVYPPSLDFVISFLACVRAGVIAVPAFPPDPRRLNKDLHMFTAIQASAGAKVVLTCRSYNYAKKVADVKSMFIGGVGWPELEWVVTDNLFFGTAPSSAFDVPSPSDVAFLQYTSGSTSEPKGVKITHGNLADNLDLIVTGLAAAEDTVEISWLPQYHDMGLIGSYLALLYCGGSGFYTSPISFIRRPSLWVELISRYHGTHMQAPNFAYGLTARKFIQEDPMPQLDLSSVRHMINAAEPVDAKSMDTFYSVFESHGLKRGVIFPTYGLAEHTVYVCSNGRDRMVLDRLLLETQGQVRPADNKLELWTYGSDGGGTVGSQDDGIKTVSLVGCGRPSESHGVDLRIVDTATSIALTEGHVGEIWIRSKSTAAGYWNQAKKTQQDFGGRLLAPAEPAAGPEGQGSTANGKPPEASAPFEGNGSNGVPSTFLKTGDLGFLWQGELYITGRMKDLIIVRGRNHYPQDMEKTAQEAVPGALRGGCSAAFSLPATACGEGVALVAEVADPSAESLGDLVDSVRKAVSTVHGVSLSAVRLLRPRTVPKTTSGKIARSWCKRAHLEGTLDSLLLWKEGKLDNDANTLEEERSWALGQDDTNGAGNGSRELPGMGGAGAEAGTQGTEEGDAILKAMQEEVAKILKCTPSGISTDAALMDLGLDSMEGIQLVALLEERFAMKGKIPETLLAEEGISLRDLSVIIKGGGVLPDRTVAISCGDLAALEAEAGPPKPHMTFEATESRRLQILGQCSVKAALGTGKFRPGSLAPQVPISRAEATRAWRFMLWLQAFPVAWQVIVYGMLASPAILPLLARTSRVYVVAWVLVCMVAFLVVTLPEFAFRLQTPASARYSTLRVSLLKKHGLMIVVEGKQDPSATLLFVGAGLGLIPQLLLATAAPGALGREIRPTFGLPKGFFQHLFPSGLLSLLGHTRSGAGSVLQAGESACMEVRVPAEASSGVPQVDALVAPVVEAMRHRAEVVPCVSVPSRLAVEGAGAVLGEGLTIVCCQPVHVPFASNPAPGEAVKYAEMVRVAMLRALGDYSPATGAQ